MLVEVSFAVHVSERIELERCVGHAATQPHVAAATHNAAAPAPARKAPARRASARAKPPAATATPAAEGVQPAPFSGAGARAGIGVNLNELFGRILGREKRKK